VLVVARVSDHREALACAGLSVGQDCAVDAVHDRPMHDISSDGLVDAILAGVVQHLVELELPAILAVGRATVRFGRRGAARGCGSGSSAVVDGDGAVIRVDLQLVSGETRGRPSPNDHLDAVAPHCSASDRTLHQSRAGTHSRYLMQLQSSPYS